MGGFLKRLNTMVDMNYDENNTGQMLEERMRAVLSKMSGWRAGLGHPHSARRLASQLSNFSFHELTASISPDTDTAEVQRALATL